MTPDAPAKMGAEDVVPGTLDWYDDEAKEVAPNQPGQLIPKKEKSAKKPSNCSDPSPG